MIFNNIKMKTNYYLLLVTCFLTAVSYVGKAQEISQYNDLRRYIGKGYVTTLDSAKTKITYSLQYVPDSLEPKRIMKDRKILLIGNKINHFYSYYVRQADSVLTADYDKGKKSAPIKRPIDVMGEGYEIFSNYPDRGTQAIIEPVTNLSNYQYEESAESPQWTICEDTSTVLNYSCQKATTRFRGRDWEAWFSPAVPLNAGPWKLHGLPGLILKAADSRNHYVFECIGLEQLKGEKEPILRRKKSNNDITCTREEYRKAQKQFYDNYVNALLATGFNVNIVDDRGNRLERLETLDKSIEERKIMWSTTVNMKDRYRKIPYNPIELE
jgi:GLPGLI family protein